MKYLELPITLISWTLIFSIHINTIKRKNWNITKYYFCWNQLWHHVLAEWEVPLLWMVCRSILMVHASNKTSFDVILGNLCMYTQCHRIAHYHVHPFRNLTCNQIENYKHALKSKELQYKIIYRSISNYVCFMVRVFIWLSWLLTC